jgi:RNA polymerase sigma factor (sigma-70 family)
LAAAPSIGRAYRVEGSPAPEADVTRALYEQYANQVFRYCQHQLGSREEAEDAVQSTFLNAFRGIKRGVVPELEAAWLFKIAHNVCLSRRRSAWRRGRIESPADFEVIEELTPAPSRRSDELIGLQDVLEQMPETQRRAILLREWQGLSYREIAAELELSQAAVETLIFRARRSLASGLEQPPATKKRRIARAFDWGNVLAGLKTALIGGSVAAKVAATVAVVSATTVVAAGPMQHHQRHWVPNVPPAHAAAPVIAHAAAPARQPAARVSAAAPSLTPAARRLRPATPVHRVVHAPAGPAALAAPPASAEPPVIEAPNEPVQEQTQRKQGDHGQSGRHDQRDEHGQPKDTRLPSAILPVQPVEPQAVVASDSAEQNTNGRGEQGHDQSKGNDQGKGKGQGGS